MTIKSTALAGMRRPRILIESARIGEKVYRRSYVLNRLFKGKWPDSQKAIVASLLAQESDVESIRKLGDGTYDAYRHVLVMTALIAENR